MAGTSLEKSGHDGGGSGCQPFHQKGSAEAGAELAMTVEAALSDG
jgi:hypothetical protein